MPKAPNEEAEAFFLTRLQDALSAVGVSEIFIDTRTMQVGDEFESRIHRTIADCDLFVELIGRDWLGILNEKQANQEPDVLVQEITAALQLDKDIVPLLIDGATMPKAGDLPPAISALAGTNAKSVLSTMSVEELGKAFERPANDARITRRLGAGWTTGYFIATFLAWCIIAVVPNAVGIREFGEVVWFSMAAYWSGLFIWPLFFFPFIFMALYRPFQILLEAALNARTTRDSLTFLSPLAIGTVVAAVATFLEIAPPQTPWTIHPALATHCDAPTDDGPRSPEARTAYMADRQALFTYGQTSTLRERYASQFWMRDKCWPNVFHYLTIPMIDNRADDAYRAERSAVVAAMNRYLAIGSKERKGTDAPYSYVFPFYVLSFFLITVFLFSAMAMAVIYAFVSIRRSRDDKVLRVPTEDAYLCLNFAFVTLMVWMPFRISTNTTKAIYTCANERSTCEPALDMFAKDGMFGLALMIGYCFLAVGILWTQKRVLLAFFGTVCVSAMAGGAYLVARYHDIIGNLTGYWVFWTALSLVICFILIALWYLYDPAIVRLRDVIRATRRDRDSTRAIAQRHQR